MPLENEMNDLRMELKVCEGCGALWVRTGATAGVYCRSCAGRLSQFPAPKSRRVSKIRVRHGAQSSSGGVVAIAGGAR